MEQKFKRGDLVMVAKDQGLCRSHFQGGEEAIVIGSYADQFGGSNTSDYTVMFVSTGGQSSWYPEQFLTFICHAGEEAIGRLIKDREERAAVQQDLKWILANWAKIRHSVPGPTMAYLMARCGITNPWGIHGEGVTYYYNLRWTFMHVDPAFRKKRTTLGRANRLLERLKAMLVAHRERGVLTTEN